jgi:hypothetical protein
MMIAAPALFPQESRHAPPTPRHPKPNLRLPKMISLPKMMRIRMSLLPVQNMKLPKRPQSHHPSYHHHQHQKVQEFSEVSLDILKVIRWMRRLPNYQVKKKV